MQSRNLEKAVTPEIPRMRYVTETLGEIILSLRRLYPHTEITTLGSENCLWVNDPSIERLVGDIYPTYAESLGTRDFAFFGARPKGDAYSITYVFGFGGQRYKGSEFTSPNIAVMDVANNFAELIGAKEVNHWDDGGFRFNPSKVRVVLGRERRYESTSVVKKYQNLSLELAKDEFLQCIEVYRKLKKHKGKGQDG